MHVVIVGNGISGVTTARYIRKHSDHKITIISGESKHFWSRTALMYIYMGHMKFEHTKPYEDHFWKKNRIELQQAWITVVDYENQTLTTKSNEVIQYDKLVLALGSSPNKFGWPGQDLDRVSGLYSLQDLQRLEGWSNEINHGVIVGGGLIGIELAEMLRSRGQTVTMLVREHSFWDNVLPPQESEMINRHIREHHIDLRLETELKEIIGDENGRAIAVITNDGERIDCQFVGLTAGVHPNIDIVKNTAMNVNRGIKVSHKMETNMANVYAVGDCAEFVEPLPNRRPIEQVWYTGKMHGIIAAKNICGIEEEYDPGPWFNSAKFLDIEYQTYGVVLAQLKENQAEIYWEHQNGKKCIHIVYDKPTRQFVGINSFGIRYKHQFFDVALRNGATVDQIIEQLELANFDPEFFETINLQDIKVLA